MSRWSTIPIDSTIGQQNIGYTETNEIYTETEEIAADFEDYQRHHDWINKLEYAASLGLVQEIPKMRPIYTKDKRASHTLLGILREYDAQRNRLYLVTEPLQTIPNTKNDKPWVQISRTNPLFDYIGKVVLQKDESLDRANVQRDDLGYYVTLNPDYELLQELQDPDTARGLRVDVYDSYCSYTRNKTALHKLCKQPRSKLAQLLIRQRFEPGEFEDLNRSDRFTVESVQEEIKRVSNTWHLNETQARAITVALTSNVHCIQGPPGTGKSLTTLALVDAFLGLQQRENSQLGPAMVSAPSNASVSRLDRDTEDKITKRLIRLGKASDQQHKPELEGISFSHWCSEFPENEVKEACVTAKVITGTCSMFGQKILDDHDIHAGLTVLDEAARTKEIDALPLVARLAKKAQAVFIGDPNQLKPYVRDEEALRIGADTSFMCRLKTEPGPMLA